MDQTELLEHYKRIIEISQQLGSTYDHVSLLRKIVFAAKELIGTEAAAILLKDDSSGKLRFAMSSNITTHQMEEILVPLEGSIAGWIFTHGEPRVIENVEGNRRHYQGVDNAINFDTRNLLGVPMRTHTDVIGVVEAVNKMNGEPFTDDDIVTLRTLASQAAMAIENARLFQQSDFIAEMVHELRTPLTSLKLSASLLKHAGLPEQERERTLRTIISETDRLMGLTNDFLDIARLESGRISLDLGSFSLRELIDESMQVVEHQAVAKKIVIHADHHDYLAEADRGKIKQVVLNLLTNAIKYNKPEGEIFITTVPHYEHEEHPMVQISVRDTGYGISPEHQKNMFQKFYRVPSLENVERGTGLGLAICKTIVETHGGRIWLKSKEGVGSTFSFTIPLDRKALI